MAPNKLPSSYRLSPECRDLINRLAEALGISQAGVIEQAVRKLARAELPLNQQPGGGSGARQRPPRAR